MAQARFDPLAALQGLFVRCRYLGLGSLGLALLFWFVSSRWKRNNAIWFEVRAELGVVGARR